MVVGTMGERMMMSRKRDIELGSPCFENMELYAVFVPPRQPLKKRKRIIVATPSDELVEFVPSADPMAPPSPPMINRMTHGTLDHAIHAISPDSDRAYQELLQAPKLSFETEKSGNSSRHRHHYKEDPKVVMGALMKCMETTEHSRSRLNLDRKKFPKNVLEVNDRLLHSNTTRKKLIWAFQAELGVSIESHTTFDDSSTASSHMMSHNSPGRSLVASSSKFSTPVRPVRSVMIPSKKSPDRYGSKYSPGRVSFAPKPLPPSPSQHSYNSHNSPSRVSHYSGDYSPGRCNGSFIKRPLDIPSSIVRRVRKAP